MITKREAKKRRKKLLKMAKRLKKEAHMMVLPFEKVIAIRMATDYEKLAEDWSDYIKSFK